MHLYSENSLGSKSYLGTRRLLELKQTILANKHKEKKKRKLDEEPNTEQHAQD
jgi:hypothetical protein